MAHGLERVIEMEEEKLLVNITILCVLPTKIRAEKEAETKIKTHETQTIGKCGRYGKHFILFSFFPLLQQRQRNAQVQDEYVNAGRE